MLALLPERIQKTAVETAEITIKNHSERNTGQGVKRCVESLIICMTENFISSQKMVAES
jgi:hypothetical protein